MFSLSLGFDAAFPTTSLCGQARSQPPQGLSHRSSLGYCLTAGGSLYSVSCALVSKLFSKVAQLSKPSKCGPKICRTPDLERTVAVSSPPAIVPTGKMDSRSARWNFSRVILERKDTKSAWSGKTLLFQTSQRGRRIEVTTCLQIEDRRPSRLQVSLFFFAIRCRSPHAVASPRAVSLCDDLQPL